MLPWIRMLISTPFVAAEAARKKLKEKESAKTNLENKRNDVKKLLGFDYGRSILVWSLSSSCMLMIRSMHDQAPKER